MHGTPASTTSVCPGSPCMALCPAARLRTSRPQGSAFARYRVTDTSAPRAPPRVPQKAMSAWLRLLRMIIMLLHCSLAIPNGDVQAVKSGALEARCLSERRCAAPGAPSRGSFGSERGAHAHG